MCNTNNSQAINQSDTTEVTTTTKAQIPTQVGTKGILNVINEKYGCNQKRRSVPINNLIRYHKPKQSAELIALIESHMLGGQHADCKCGCRSAGTLKDFADNLFDAYNKFIILNPNTEYKSWDDCYIFMKHLFVTASLSGSAMEYKVLRRVQDFLKLKLPEYNLTAAMASETHDFKYAVDISIYDASGKELFGIQVKPVSYANIPKDHSIVLQNVQKNKDYGLGVIYIYYTPKLDIIRTVHYQKGIMDRVKSIYKSGTARSDEK